MGLNTAVPEATPARLPLLERLAVRKGIADEKARRSGYEDFHAEWHHQ